MTRLWCPLEPRGDPDWQRARDYALLDLFGETGASTTQPPYEWIPDVASLRADLVTGRAEEILTGRLKIEAPPADR